MTIGLSSTLRDNRLTVIKDAVDAGSGAGTLKFYTAPRPSTGGAGGDVTLLGTLTLNDPCGTVSAGVLTFDVDPTIVDSSADDTGTAVWARLADSDGTFVADLSVGVAMSGADIILNTTSIVITGSITMTSGTITEGNA